MTCIHAQLGGAAMTPSPAWRQRGSRRFPEATLTAHDPCLRESHLDAISGTFRAGSALLETHTESGAERT